MVLFEIRALPRRCGRRPLRWTGTDRAAAEAFAAAQQAALGVPVVVDEVEYEPLVTGERKPGRDGE